jgi:outer membrane protein assembly factor BamB
MMYVVNGLPGEMYAVRTGGSGDVTDSHMAWHTPRRAGRDLPSPMVVGEYLLVLGMNGILSCYQAQSGKELWKERIGAAYACSPFEAAGHVYLQSETGETTVIEPGEQLKVIAQNSLEGDRDEIFRAGLAPSNGQFFTRSDRYLYCIGGARNSQAAN